uniref:Blo t Ves m 1 allergen n=1 Tax=Blomia tropicalis TaxID=40697 RepID=A1KXJ3_BLOTA|nr:Blo t Ves m 1 allergen [Blomia tropicalis]
MISNGKRLAFIIHGFGNSYTTERLVSIKDSLLSNTDDIETVIMVDWKRGAAKPNYIEASVNTQVVGRQITFMVNQMKNVLKLDPKNVYLIGFSLGAQVAGFAGKYSQTEYGWKYGRISGLDAAAPLFEKYPGSYLTKDDAIFVDAIHTSAGHNLIHGEIGFIEPYAHVDFYPNGGHNQPMCHNLLKISCNHYASVLFFDASVSAHNVCHFMAFGHCPNWSAFTEHKCTKSDGQMGYLADHFHMNGVQYLSTTNSYPFCNI